MHLFKPDLSSLGINFYLEVILQDIYLYHLDPCQTFSTDKTTWSLITRVGKVPDQLNLQRGVKTMPIGEYDMRSVSQGF